MAHAWPLPPAIASRCAANDGSCKRRRRSPTRRCSTCSSADEPGCAPPLPPARSVRPPGRDTTQLQNPRDDAATVDASPACAADPSCAPSASCGRRSRAAIDILPFQLEPALALVRGHASRFLLADEVGLGKTIQAGLMLAELRQRGWCEHALIVTPAGLRQQWAEELRHRFEHSRSGHGCRVARGARRRRCRST